ncbi:hypothetical protein HPT25_14370 [Bacillus sp. BRMEA1]|uniref:hypothetical protein n=1 Tax=Neobacillus endophyticus TaxID=2738405 RepID=UPI0015675B0A|nr:hypothetical protein [Neobacillus endophyticus]NRD78546.1 hypothetical protein [Neobacillus endophyticus]
MKNQYTKVILSGRLLEVSQQSTPPLVPRKSAGGRKPYGSVEKMNHDTNKKVSINRARAEIKRLLECNFQNHYAFLTLTFRPSKEHDYGHRNLPPLPSFVPLFDKEFTRLRHFLYQ